MILELLKQQKQALKDLNLEELKKINKKIFELREQKRKERETEKEIELLEKCDCRASAFCSMLDR